MQDAGLPLKRSAVVVKGQRVFSCHSCMQQVVHHHITSGQKIDHYNNSKWKEHLRRAIFSFIHLVFLKSEDHIKAALNCVNLYRGIKIKGKK